MLNFMYKHKLIITFGIRQQKRILVTLGICWLRYIFKKFPYLVIPTLEFSFF